MQEQKIQGAWVSQLRTRNGVDIPKRAFRQFGVIRLYFIIDFISTVPILSQGSDYSRIYYGKLCVDC